MPVDAIYFQDGREGAEECGARHPGVSELPGQICGAYAQHSQVIRFYEGKGLLRVASPAGQGRGGDEALLAHHERASGFKIVMPPQSLQLFKGKQHIHLTPGDQGRVHPLAVSHVTHHHPSPLGHAVDLTLLHVKARQEGRSCQHLRCQENPLASYSGEEHVPNSHEPRNPEPLWRPAHRCPRTRCNRCTGRGQSWPWAFP